MYVPAELCNLIASCNPDAVDAKKEHPRQKQKTNWGHVLADDHVQIDSLSILGCRALRRWHLFGVLPQQDLCPMAFGEASGLWEKSHSFQPLPQ